MAAGVAAGAALVLAIAAPATAASPRLLPCAPPENIALQLVNEQTGWTAHGEPVAVRITRQAVLRREGPGWLLAVGVPIVRSSLAGEAAQRLLASFRAMRPMRLTLGADGGVIDIADEAAQWSAAIDRLADPLGPGGSERAAAVRQRLEAMDPQARRQVLAGFWLPYVRFCGRWLGADEAARHSGERLVLTREDDPTPMPGVQTLTRFALDPATGLARAIERTTTALAAPDRPQTERWTLDPWPAP